MKPKLLAHIHLAGFLCARVDGMTSPTRRLRTGEHVPVRPPDREWDTKDGTVLVWDEEPTRLAVLAHRLDAGVVVDGSVRLATGGLIRDEREPEFWSRIAIGDPAECWLWSGYARSDGYPNTFKFEGASWAPYRLAYVLTLGPVPDGLHLDHLCNVRFCCNPAHLEPVTLAENNRRMAARKTHCINGHEYRPETTSWINNGKQRARRCRVCVNERARANRAAERRGGR